MEGDYVIQLIVLVVLLLLSAFFSSAETALTTVNQIHMRSRMEEGDKKAELVLRITENSAKMLSAILIGNNLVNISASSIATTLAVAVFGSKGAGIATGILTLLILIFGEISPKTMASLRAEKMSLRYCRIIWIWMQILTPVIAIINFLAGAFLRLFGVKSLKKQNTLTEQELRTIVDVSEESGVIEEEEKQMINNLFDFGDAEAKEIMIPRIDVTFLDVNATYDDVMDAYREDKYTRYPVYEENNDNVIGMLNMKDMILTDRDHFSMRALLRTPHFTYEHKNLAELFVEMRQKFASMAIVLDDYGSTAGVITMEDLLEEIVGEIRDEYDRDEEEPCRQLSANEYIVDAGLNLEDFGNTIDIPLESEDYDSVGGYMMELLDHIPRVKESVVTPEQIYMQVLSTDRRRLKKIFIRLPLKEEVEEGEQTWLEPSAIYHFPLEGEPESVEPLGDGHINTTYLVTTTTGRKYVLQKIKDDTFDVPALMENVTKVIAHLKEKTEDPRGCLNLIYDHSGNSYYKDESGYYRVYDFIENTICLTEVEQPEDFYQNAAGFGTFQTMMADFSIEELKETIPQFHNTIARYEQLQRAVTIDAYDRAGKVQQELSFALDRKEEAGVLQRMRDNGELPLRVTHNDTKMSNIMLDADTRKAVCVIDLDTVMPGLVAYDFGDAIRSGASRGAEDEKDGLVFDLELFRIYTRGFLAHCPILTKAEIESLAIGAKIMTLECGVRFLTDYLSGDHYFATQREGQNLDRARRQFQLVAQMEEKWDQMLAIVQQEASV